MKKLILLTTTLIILLSVAEYRAQIISPVQYTSTIGGTQMNVLNDSLIFIDYLGHNLYKSDGINPPVLIKALPADYYQYDYSVNSSLFCFTLGNGSGLYQVYETNGTTAGTNLLKSSADQFCGKNVVTVMDTIYFTGGDSIYRINPNGTKKGIMKSTNPNVYNLFPYKNNYLAIVKGNGTTAAPNGLYLYDVNARATSTIFNNVQGAGSHTIHNDSLYISVTPVNTGYSYLYEVVPGNFSYNAVDTNHFVYEILGTINNKILFSGAIQGSSDYELYCFDPHTRTTNLIMDIKPGGASSGINSPAAGLTKFYFVADDGTGAEPWVTDGTTSGTHKIADLSPTGTNTSGPTMFYHTGDLKNAMTFFKGDTMHTSYDGGATGVGYKYYITDGISMWPVNIGTSTPSAGYWTQYHNDVFFTLDDANGTVERLYKFHSPSNTAYAGPAQIICGTTANLSANTPLAGTGSWTFVSGSGTFTNPSSPSSSVSGLAMGANVFKWTITYNSQSTSSQVTITRLAPPNVTANASLSTVCSGASVTLTGGGATTYLWTNGVTNGVVFHPTTSNTYTVTGTDANGCTNTATQLITVNPLPTVTITATSYTVCTGGSTTLTGSGTATSFSWSGGVTNGVSFSPTSTLTYTLTGTDGNGCSKAAFIRISVNPIPTVTANASASVVCSGGSVTLTGGGATTYSWTNGVTNGVVFYPTATNTYTVTGTGYGSGCVNTATKLITVNPLPTVTANATATTFCVGGSTILTGGGATSYNWSGGVSDGVSFNPTNTTTYTVTGTDGNSCVNTATQLITVNQLPNVTVNSPAICPGLTANLTANGANTYAWSSGATSTGVNTADVTPSSTTTYTVTGTDGNGCVNTAVSTVTIGASLTININSPTICAGQTANLNATGAASYTWPSGTTSTGTNTATASPASTTSYSVTGTNGSCSGTGVTTVTVNPLPIATTTNSSGITITSNQNSATYQWLDCNNGNSPISSATNQSYTATSNGDYAVAVSLNGCSDTSACVLITTVGIAQNDLKGGISIAPNPFTSQTIISFSEPQKNTSIKIMDVVGKEIKTVLFSGKSLILEKGEMQSGVYFVQITDEKKNVVNKKVVVE